MVVIVFLVYLILALIVGSAASKRGRSAVGWFVLAAVATPVIAAILLLLFPVDTTSVDDRVLRRSLNQANRIASVVTPVIILIGIFLAALAFDKRQYLEGLFTKDVPILPPQTWTSSDRPHSCYSDGDVITVKGVAAANSLELANGTLTRVWLLTLDSAICVRDPISVAEAPHEMSVRRVQIIGQSPPSDSHIELAGKVSTGNITQYFAVPTSLNVIRGRRIAAP
jgi:hypothetical protein